MRESALAPPLGLLLILAAGLAGCSRKEAPAPQAAADPLNRNDFAAPWQTETDYVVTRIASELADYYQFAALPAGAPYAAPKVTARTVRYDGHDPVVRVDVEGIRGSSAECELQLAGGIFALKTYDPLQEELEKAVGGPLRPDGTEAEGIPANGLLGELESDVLSADASLSKALAGHFTSPGLHEDAAALIGIFAWRDNSGLFHNLLPELARMTAHRAFARRLARVSPGPTGVLAKALEDALIGREVDAVADAKALPDTGFFPAWSRIIRTRATGDYRIVADQKDAPLLQRVEYFREAVPYLRGEVGSARFPVADAELGVADWWRVVAWFRTVGSGHLMLREGLEAELNLAARARAAYGPAAPDTASLAAAMNAPEGSTVTGSPGGAGVAILGWGLWAHFLQGHVCSMISSDFDFMMYAWGVPEDARSFRSEMDAKFGVLVLYPLVRRLDSTEEPYYRRAQDDAMRLVRAAPEKVPALAWNRISAKPSFCSYYCPPPHPFINEWHRDNPLPGTVYDFQPRLMHPSMNGRPDAKELAGRLLQMAPWNPDVIYFDMTRRYTVKFTGDAAASAYAPVVDYISYMGTYIAGLYGDEGNLAKEEEWLKRTDDLDSTADLGLAELYRDEGRTDEAAAAYVKWMRSAEDAVFAANNSEWLVMYFEHHDLPGEAAALANRAATVYSMGGLRAKARLLEDRDDPKGAFQVYKAIDERYDNSLPLLGFLLRHKGQDDDDVAPGLLEKLLAEKFPKGLARMDASDAAPRDGAWLPAVGPRARSLGLERGDVVGGILGYRIHSVAELKAVRTFQGDEAFVLTVWRNGKWTDVKVGRDNGFAGGLRDYATKS